MIKWEGPHSLAIESQAPGSFKSSVAQHLAQLSHAEDWAQAIVERLSAEGFEETAPGVFEKGDTQVAF